MFERKPNSEVYLRIVEHFPDYLMHHDPIVYKKGTEWTMPGPAAELYTPPTVEEMGPEIAGRGEHDEPSLGTNLVVLQRQVLRRAKNCSSGDSKKEGSYGFIRNANRGRHGG